MHEYRKKSLKLLMFLLVVFLAVFFISVVYLYKNVPIIDLDGGYKLSNYIVISFSLLAILKIIVEIVNIEHHHEFEKRVHKIVGKKVRKKIV